MSVLAVAAVASRGDPDFRAALGLRLHEPRDARDADDGHANPGMLWCSRAPPSGAGRSRRGPRLRECTAMPARHVRAWPPDIRPSDAARDGGQSRATHQYLPRRPPAGAIARYESRSFSALTAYVARQSRGLPIDVAIDAHTQPFLDAGRHLPPAPGQLNLACAQCHDANWEAAAGNVIPQAHPPVPALSAGVAGARLAPAAPAQLSRRHPPEPL